MEHNRKSRNNPINAVNLFLKKNVKQFNKGRIFFLTNGNGAVEYSYQKALV